MNIEDINPIMGLTEFFKVTDKLEEEIDKSNIKDEVKEILKIMIYINRSYFLNLKNEIMDMDLKITKLLIKQKEQDSRNAVYC